MKTPRDYQEAAINATFHYFEKGNIGNPLIAMPTGTGKSLVIAETIKQVIQRYPSQRIVALTHVKELITQNADALCDQWPSCGYGINSAGLKQRDTANSVIFGGIASVKSIAERLGHRDLMLVDEAHLLGPNDDSMYGTVIAGLKQINPKLKVIGYTATPYRQGMGSLTNGSIFTDIAFDITGMNSFNRLIHDGWLCPVYPKRTQVELDVSNVGMANGDFLKNELEDAVNEDKVTYAACKEIFRYGQDRTSWLVFTSGIKHAEHVARILQSFGIAAACVHSKLESGLRDERLKRFKSGLLQCLVTYNIGTTGFDHPPVDLIGMLRPTMSVGLWVQMVGRGTRPSPETMKQNCLVLDFAGNTKRLGPINDPYIPKKRKKGEAPGDLPVKICEHCGTYNHCSARFCIDCGREFSITPQITQTAGTEELLRSNVPQIETFNVERVLYGLHEKDGSPPMIQVSYLCGIRMFKEFVCLEHEGHASKLARDWWRIRMGTVEAPPTTAEALKWISKLAEPRRIRVWINKKYPQVMGYEELHGH